MSHRAAREAGRDNKVLVFLGILASVIGAIVLWVQAGQMRYGGESLVVTGFVTLIVGSLASWVSSFVLYGFGQLVENSDIITAKMAGTPTHLASTLARTSSEPKRVHPLLSNTAAARTCPDCGATLNSAHSSCLRCGADIK